MKQLVSNSAKLLLFFLFIFLETDLSVYIIILVTGYLPFLIFAKKVKVLQSELIQDLTLLIFTTYPYIAQNDSKTRNQ